MSKKLKTKNPLVKILWVLIVLMLACLAFFGIKYFLTISKPGYYAGEIFGEKVPTERYKTTYDHVATITHFQYGKMFDSLEPMLDLDEQAWDTLMMLKDAKKKHISASNKEVVAEISKYKFFFRGKNFDALLYKNIIRNSLKTEPRNFEEAMREFIIKRKLQKKVTSSVSITDDEILQEYKDRYENMQISYIEVPPDNYKKDISVSDKEVQKYYNEHKKELLKPKSVNAEYVNLDFPKDGGIQKQVEMKYKAKAIIDEYNKTKDFKESAGKLKFQVKESGLFSKDAPNNDIGLEYPDIIKLFKADKGQVLEPFKTEKGYIVVRIKDKRNPYIPSLQEDKYTIKKTLITQKARLLALDQAKKNYEKIIKKWSQSNGADKDFAKIAKGMNLEVKQTPVLSKLKTAYTLGLVDKFEKYKSDLFSLTKKEPIGHPILTIKGALIPHLDLFEPYKEEQFKKDKDVFSKNLLDIKKETAFSDYIKDLKEKADLIYF